MAKDGIECLFDPMTGKYPEPFTHPLLEGEPPPPIPEFFKFMAEKMAERTGYSKAAIKTLLPIFLEECRNYFIRAGKFTIPGLIHIYIRHKPEGRQGINWNMIRTECIKYYIHFDRGLEKEMKTWKWRTHQAVARLFWKRLRGIQSILANPASKQRMYEVIKQRDEIRRKIKEEDAAIGKYLKQISDAGHAAAMAERKKLEDSGVILPPVKHSRRRMYLGIPGRTPVETVRHVKIPK